MRHLLTLMEYKPHEVEYLLRMSRDFKTRYLAGEVYTPLFPGRVGGSVFREGEHEDEAVAFGGRGATGDAARDDIAERAPNGEGRNRGGHDEGDLAIRRRGGCQGV